MRQHRRKEQNVFGWDVSEQDIDHLIARGKYSKAVKPLRSMLREHPEDIHLRQKLADVLARTGGNREAVSILELLVDEFAGDGFNAKAIAIAKKIQRIDPERTDVEQRLVGLLHRPEPSPGLLGQSAGQEPAPGEPDEYSTEVESFRLSPLFTDFSPAELLALIHGLNLLTFEPGEIVIAEGEPGTSLLVVASGRVRVYVRNDVNHQVEIRKLGAGEFFGEISILTGQPRTATVVAAEPCEILELDQANVEEIGRDYPNVPKVIREFAGERAMSPEEITARQEIELPLGWE